MLVVIEFVLLVAMCSASRRTGSCQAWMQSAMAEYEGKKTSRPSGMT